MDIGITANPSRNTAHIKIQSNTASEAIEQALNQGDNGKNLYHHLKLATPAGEEPGVDYANGHLTPLDTQRELDDSTLSEIKKQAGPTWARYSTTYNPHQEAMNDKILTLEPDSPLNTKEQMDRLSAAVRVGAPEIIAEFRARQNHMSLPVHPNHVLNPDGSVSLDDYLRA